MTEVVVGGDVGGSSTRIAVADLNGEVLGTAQAPGANPNTVGIAESGRIIAGAVSAALTATRAATRRSDVVVRAFALGLAGGSGVIADQDYLQAVRAGSVLPVIVSDLAVAFASATPAPDGYVVVGGTGAVAGRVTAHRVVEQRDGWGWLLGDEGAGFWLGRELVRSTLRALERHAALDGLHQRVLRAAGATDRLSLVQTCYRQPPIWLASLAVLLQDHPDEPSAGEVVTVAVTHLSGLVGGLAPLPGLPVVVAGSVATRPPVGPALAQELARRWNNPVVGAGSGVRGAAWIALRTLAEPSELVHLRLGQGIRELHDHQPAGRGDLS